MISGQMIIDFIQNCGLENEIVSRTMLGNDELIFEKRDDTGGGTYEIETMNLNFQSGKYYKTKISRKHYYLGENEW